MPFQPAQDTALVEIKWVQGASYAWQNNLHFSKPGFTQADLIALVDAVALSWSTSVFMTRIANSVNITALIGTDLRTEGAGQALKDVAYFGTNAAEALPVNVALVETLRTDLRGRSYRGRIFIAGISEAGWNGVVFNTNVVVDLAALLADMQGDALALGWTWSVLSRWHAGVLRPSALPRAITAYEVRSFVPGSQRARTDRL